MSRKEKAPTGWRALVPFAGPARPDDGKLGIFLGVYMPTALTILGVIMYLRLGWVVGHMELTRTLVIVVLANAITLITAVSFSAVATNIRVGLGGAYYIISRSLGLEIGGASRTAAVSLAGFFGDTLRVRSHRAPAHRLAGCAGAARRVHHRPRSRRPRLEGGAPRAQDPAPDRGDWYHGGARPVRRPARPRSRDSPGRDHGDPTAVAQANGIAGLDSNTVLMGWPSNPERVADFLRVCARLERLHKSVVIGRVHPGLRPRQGKRREIHVWWGGLQRNGDMMLLLAHLLTRNPEWRGSKIRVLSLASNEHMKAETERLLNEFLPDIRIDAETTVRLRPKDRAVREIIAEESAEADVVFLGLNGPEPGQAVEAAERLMQSLEGLRTVFFVKNASPFLGKLVSPEKGKSG